MGFCGSRLDPAAQALLQRRTAGLHGSGPLQDPVCPAENVDRQGGLSEAERADLMDLALRSEEHTSELQSLLRISYAVFCLKKNKSKKHYKCPLTTYTLTEASTTLTHAYTNTKL